ncbi:hypothetical protein H8S90_09870 [Olivibacter sp. SDN3]|uniref:hypothetical protein n=1 Tax=Olivibacter sp. SDN3 TaxID=2764720 RepID=UPI001650F438|nr:hypothetical protein [Olivibacter sp. SDN3]QNL51848.1 hypothetical protein H8S90_09870 [Olivibacter sp. SDN3]
MNVNKLRYQMTDNAVKKTIKVICCCILLLAGKFCPGRQTDTATLYLDRAGTMYSNVWTKYRVPEYAGLFLENYPSRQTERVLFLYRVNKQ